MQGYVDIMCFDCQREVPLVDADAGGFHCPTCERLYVFMLCSRCDSVVQCRKQREGGQAVCDWCHGAVRVKGLGRKDTATAADWHAETEERGMLPPDQGNVLVGGFRLLGGSGFDIDPDVICSVLSLPDGVDVRAEVGGDGVATIPYDEITDVEIAGGTVTESRRNVRTA